VLVGSAFRITVLIPPKSIIVCGLQVLVGSAFRIIVHYKLLKECQQVRITNIGLMGPVEWK
ncbi:hypothetical protein KC921_05525, partial [Candidatus Woesebacteria bacterium]|nr:hypothetical protein [Candidatus Woesebacteria bacterium]